VPIIGGSPMFELSIAVLLISGLIYWFAVQQYRGDVNTLADQDAAASLAR
jgi:hypothetical protein